MLLRSLWTGSSLAPTLQSSELTSLRGGVGMLASELALPALCWVPTRNLSGDFIEFLFCVAKGEFSFKDCRSFTEWARSGLGSKA